MNKDTIKVIKSDGFSEQMEVVATFRLEDSKKECIIYKSMNDNKFYAASYEGDSDLCNLNTEFTDKEKEQLNEIFKKLNYGGEVNA